MAIDKIKEIAASFAKEYANSAIAPPHIMKALLHREAGLVDFIESDLQKDYFYMQEWADVQMQLLPKAMRPTGELDWDEESLNVIGEADNYRLKMGKDEVDAVCLLAAIVTPGVGFTFDQLKTMPLNASEILNKVGTVPVTASSADHDVSPLVSASSPTSKGNIQKYCIDKRRQMADGKIGVVIGFESELATIYEVLGRKQKSNMLVMGEAGVGKTSLLNAFVRSMTSGEAPSFLNKNAIYELDTAALSSDAGYRGEVEDRFKKLLTELRGEAGAILIIEGIDKLFDKQGSLYGASTILKDELQKASLQLLCTTSIDGYTKHIETDKEFSTKLERITIEEPSADHCLRILEGSISQYEQFHALTIADNVLQESIRLAKRYLTEKSLPDSAFDLIDRTMSLVKTMNDITKGQTQKLRAELQELKEATGVDQDEQMKHLEWLHYRLCNEVSCLLMAKLDTDVDFAKLATVQERTDYLESTLSRIEELSAEPRNEVQSGDLFAVVAKQTGIPLGKVQSKERERLIGGEEILKKRVIGLDHAVKKVIDAIFESRSGLSKKGQPMGSFIFLGPTGTGTTEQSKALTSILFEDESSLIRFDMSEFKEEHSVALLYGAPPGYVGYEEGGLLVNKIRQNPYAVVLFDEIEKAHKSVFDLFLQILDEGKLHDRLGRVGDFSNALILFTSNIGRQHIVDSINRGVIPPSNDLMDIMQQYFRPEFLGRLTEIVPFSPITEETVTRIFEVHLKGLLKLLAEQDIKLELTPEAKHDIAMRGFNPQYGARPIIGIIRKELRTPLSKMIISGEVKGGDTVTVSIDNEGKVIFSV